MKLPKIILLFIFLCLSGCREEVAHDLPDHDVGRVITALTEVGIQAERKRQPDGKWLITVPDGEATSALQLLERRRLIRIPEPTEESASLFLNEKEQLLRFERSLSHEIEKTLLSIEGVYEAKVHLNLPSTDRLFGTKKESAVLGTGSVLIIASPDLLVTPEEVGELVSGAAGLARERISVLIKPGQPVTIDLPVQPREVASKNISWIFFAALALIGLGCALMKRRLPASRLLVSGEV